jgi:hypothetical protein
MCETWMIVSCPKYQESLLDLEKRTSSISIKNRKMQMQQKKSSWFKKKKKKKKCTGNGLVVLWRATGWFSICI